MTDQPEEPPLLDMTGELLNGLTVAQLVRFANLAVNRLTVRDFAEICVELDLRPSIELTPKQPTA